MKGFLRGMKRSFIGAAILLTLDAGFDGSCMFAWISCPIWFLVSLSKIDRRPHWGLALTRVGMPALTLGLAWANSGIQLGVGEANARRVIAACEGYHAAHGKFPRKLDDLVPQYLGRVPPAKYCLGPSSQFTYSNSSDPPLLVRPIFGHYRKIYSFQTRSWSYLD